MGVNRSRVKSLHVIQSDRRIDHESEDSRTDKIPERDRDKKVNDPLVLVEPRLHFRMPDVLKRFVTNEYKRNDLECAEHGAERECDGRRAREIKVMKRSDNAAA